MDSHGQPFPVGRPIVGGDLQDLFAIEEHARVGISVQICQSHVVTRILGCLLAYDAAFVPGIRHQLAVSGNGGPLGMLADAVRPGSQVAVLAGLKIVEREVSCGPIDDAEISAIR